MRLEAKKAPGLAQAILYPAGAIVATLLIASVLVMLAGASPFDVFYLVLKGAAGSQFAIIETLTRATPLIFTGLAVAVAFRAKLWNIGAEAQLYVGGVVTVVLGTGTLQLPAAILMPVIIACVLLGGALLLLGPAFLKIRFGVDEVVTTLLLNFIVLLFVSMLLEGVLKDPMGLGWPQSKRVIAEAQLPRLITGKRLHFGFVLALAAAFITWFIMKKSVLGYEMRAVGHNPEAAGFAGIPVRKVLIKTALLSGGLAALAGYSEVAGLRLHRHRRRHACHAQPARRGRLGNLHRRDFRRRRCHEPRHGRAQLHCPGHGGDRTADHGDRNHAVALPHPLEVSLGSF